MVRKGCVLASGLVRGEDSVSLGIFALLLRNNGLEKITGKKIPCNMKWNITQY